MTDMFSGCDLTTTAGAERRLPARRCGRGSNTQLVIHDPSHHGGEIARKETHEWHGPDPATFVQRRGERGRCRWPDRIRGTRVTLSAGAGGNAAQPSVIPAVNPLVRYTFATDRQNPRRRHVATRPMEQADAAEDSGQGPGHHKTSLVIKRVVGPDRAVDPLRTAVRCGLCRSPAGNRPARGPGPVPFLGLGRWPLLPDHCSRSDL
jgi:hypothetical protein